RADYMTLPWERIAGNAHWNPALIISSVLPKIFTPDLDRSLLPRQWWIGAVGYLWLAAAAVALFVTIGALLKNRIPDHLRRPAALLTAATCAAPLTVFLV